MSETEKNEAEDSQDKLKDEDKPKDKEDKPKDKKDTPKDEEDESSTAEELNKSHDPYFPPIITLPEVHVWSGETDEEELFKIRAKLYRYAHECNPPEWKERGTGDVKLLKHEENLTVRLLMRRDKTIKVCANHLILPWMELKPNCGSDKAWIWKVQADYADNECKSETLAIKFSNKENAQKFESAFEKARQWVLENAAAQIIQEKNGKGDPLVGYMNEEKLKTKEMLEEKSDEGKDDKNLSSKLEEMTVKE